MSVVIFCRSWMHWVVFFCSNRAALQCVACVCVQLRLQWKFVLKIQSNPSRKKITLKPQNESNALMTQFFSVRWGTQIFSSKKPGSSSMRHAHRSSQWCISRSYGRIGLAKIPEILPSSGHFRSLLCSLLFVLLACSYVLSCLHLLAWFPTCFLLCVLFCFMKWNKLSKLKCNWWQGKNPQQERNLLGWSVREELRKDCLFKDLRISKIKALKIVKRTFGMFFAEFEERSHSWK